MNGRFRIETLKGKKEAIDQTKGKNTWYHSMKKEL